MPGNKQGSKKSAPKKRTSTTPTYLLTIVGGTIDATGRAQGRFKAGDSVKILAATAPGGQQFANWTGVNVVDSQNSKATVVMPARDHTVTANYVAAGPVPLCTVTLERATFADGSVVKALPRGSTVQIKANVYNGWEFKNWNTYGWTVALASQAAITTMTVPDSALVTVSASYKQLPAPPPQPRPAPQSNTTGWIVVALFLIALAILALAASYLSKPSAAAPTAQPPAATPTPDWYAPCPAGTLADGTSYPEIKKGMTVKVELKDGSWLRLSCDYGYTTKPSSQPIDATPTAMPTAAPTVVPTTAPTLAPAVSSGNTISDALKLVGPAPYKTVEAKDEKGRKVILVNAGFDLNEFGGNDAKCTRTELDSIHIGEVVSSQSEGCLTVLEWSLKLDASTVMAGTYPLKPGEWFYIPLAVSGVNDHVRIVGTLWYLPKGWNAHMYAADLASDRDTRDATHSIVGLSPTDDYVVKLANALLGK